MPLYEYHCPKCSSDFELLIRGEEKPECPHCHSRKLKRQMSIPAAHNANSDEPSCPGAAMGCNPDAMPCCGGRRGCVQ